jgi:serine/threonine protein kinase
MSDKTVPMKIHQGGAAATDIGIAETHAMPPGDAGHAMPDQSMTRNRVPAPQAPAQPFQPQPTAVAPAAGQAQWVGRFRLLEQLGAGAAGIVYRAHDPQLDRMVAVKLLHANSRAAGAHDDRLLREAKGLARVTHPNVVGVHDVGMHADQLFVAMELVEGRTLTQWLTQRLALGSAQAPNEAPSSTGAWRQVLSVMIAAGHGLHAIHEAGLVHRDFKPDNVLIDEHGRARIADFGLVRAADDPQLDNESADYGSSPLGPSMTQTGALMGTPAFMAPEQLQRRAADARSDQFAFCVTLYEALYGQPPFVASTIAEQMHATSSGAVQQVPASTTVPRALHDAIMQGLSPAPEQRYPDMAALLSALDAATSVQSASRPPRLALWLAVAGVSMLLLAVGAWALFGVPASDSTPSKAAAKALDKARKQRDASKYASCARTASMAKVKGESPRSGKLIDVWLNCALLADDWDHAGRACKAWNKNVDDPLPSSCEPTVVKAYALMAKKNWRGCLKKVLSDDKPNKHNLAVRMVCAHHAEDTRAYASACKLIKRKFPQYGPAQDCTARILGTSGDQTAATPAGPGTPKIPRAAPRVPEAGRSNPRNDQPKLPPAKPPTVQQNKPVPPKPPQVRSHTPPRVDRDL